MWSVWGSVNESDFPYIIACLVDYVEIKPTAFF